MKSKSGIRWIDADGVEKDLDAELAAANSNITGLGLDVTVLKSDVTGLRSDVDDSLTEDKARQLTGDFALRAASVKSLGLYEHNFCMSKSSSYIGVKIITRSNVAFTGQTLTTWLNVNGYTNNTKYYIVSGYANYNLVALGIFENGGTIRIQPADGTINIALEENPTLLVYHIREI